MADLEDIDLAEHERVLADAIVDVATELRLADPTEFIMLVRGEQATIPSLESQLQQQLIGLGILVGVPPEQVTVTPGTLDTLSPLPGTLRLDRVAGGALCPPDREHQAGWIAVTASGLGRQQLLG